MTGQRDHASAKSPATRWSVGSHIVAIVLVAMLAFAGVTAVIAVGDFRAARATAMDDTAFQARLGAGAVAEAVSQGQQVLTSMLAQPSTVEQIAYIVADPRVCPLEIANLGIFAESAMHFLGPAGDVKCSSDTKDAYKTGATFAGMPFFAELAKATTPVDTGLLIDPVTKRRSAGHAALVRNGSGRAAGAIVFDYALDSANETMERTYAGPHGVEFTLVDGETGTILFSTEAPARVGAEMPPAIKDRTWLTGLDGTRRLYRAGDVTGTNWWVAGSLPERVALREARGDLVEQAMAGAVVLLVTLVLGLMLNRRIAGPLRRLQGAVQQAAREIDPAPVEVRGPAEVGAVLQSFNELVEAKRAADARLEHHLMHDLVTGLPNRLVFADRLDLALARTRRSGATTAVFLIGLERMARIRSAIGVEHGDLVLATMAARIPEVLRPSDTVARYSNDILAVFCEEIPSDDQAGVVAERIRSAVSLPVGLPNSDDVATSAFVGVALSRHGDTVDGVLRAADQAMSEARVAEKRIAFAKQDGRHDAAWRLKAEGRLRRAIVAGEIGVHYQPVVDVATEAPLGFEALARWIDPELGFVSPAEFIPIAEESGLIRSLGRFVMMEACKQAAAWRTAGHPIEIAVNVSTKQLLAADFPDQVRAALDDARLEAEALRLEITESVLIGDTAADDALRRLKEIGVKLSVDDFGTGFSSLSYLRRFPIDQLKIDRAFIADLEHTSATFVLVKAIIDMARALGVEVVAEGVETHRQAAMLRELGCSSAQGYLFARPDVAERAEGFLKQALLTAGAPARRIVSLN